MGTMLQDAGLPVGGAPEAWLLENPDAVKGVHRAYLDAGADLILSCTFGGNRARLKQVGLESRVAEVNRRAVEIARAAVADAAAYVAAAYV
ncbi:MAG TPA: 5-methyltetrahydrofolate--homocysteine methyltransferase, partial [Chloroflexi bacterium]|nr:5-methyltetrahydrofolate--homocysteine methyltransferase [Chloroflexota bacterium]